MDYRKAYSLSLRFLNRRFLSEGELRTKLAAKEIGEDIIDTVIDDLKKEKFIDDLRLAAAVYRYYAKKEKYGHLYVCNKLRQRQLPIPEERETINEYAIAGHLLEEKFRGDSLDERKVARFLQYRGFSVSVIRELLNNLAK